MALSQLIDRPTYLPILILIFIKTIQIDINQSISLYIFIINSNDKIINDHSFVIYKLDSFLINIKKQMNK